MPARSPSEAELSRITPGRSLTGPALPFFNMPKTISVFVGPADSLGQIELVYVHADPVALRSFGLKEAPRVSNVRFDFDAQEFVGELLDGREIARHAQRAVVTENERQIVNDMFGRGEDIPGGWKIVDGKLTKLDAPAHA